YQQRSEFQHCVPVRRAGRAWSKLWGAQPVRAGALRPARFQRPHQGTQRRADLRRFIVPGRDAIVERKAPLKRGFLIAETERSARAPLARLRHISMSPMPPMPPMPPPIGFSSLGDSATIASVVSIRLATDDAFCSAKRATLVGS